ncbi:MAG: hypothetical protein DMD91_17140 [Candidatus Rokuibacteriota bacterium]|nr:MAG: hypothetical protein DMD91_17140 [Candidatus Rokubacteria bacterium]
MVGVVRAAGRPPAEASGEMVGVVRAAGRPPAEASGEMVGVVRAEACRATRRAVKWSGSCEPRRAARRGER